MPLRYFVDFQKNVLARETIASLVASDRMPFHANLASKLSISNAFQFFKEGCKFRIVFFLFGLILHETFSPRSSANSIAANTVG